MSSVYELVERLEAELKKNIPNAQVMVIPSRSPRQNAAAA